MKLPPLLQKPLQIAALSAGALLGSGVENEAQAQQTFYPEVYGREINYVAGDGVTGPTVTSFMAREFEVQIKKPTRNNTSPYQNSFNPYGSNLNSNRYNFNANGNNSSRSQGQTLSIPQSNSNSGYSPNQVDPRSIEKQKRHEAILEQIKNAKTSPDGNFKYVLNINDSKFHLIIPISKDFQLPEMNEMYRVKFKDPFKAGTPYYYLVSNDSIETSYQQQQTKAGSQTSTTQACRNTTSSLRKLCCPCK